MASTNLIPNNTSFSIINPSNTLELGWNRQVDVNSFAYGKRGRAFRVLANRNGSQVRSSARQVIMVDPLEAKRLAVKQMQQIKAKENLKRQRQIEAINGAWAMIGLTAALVIEGQTGKSIPSQLASYWNTIFHVFIP